MNIINGATILEVKIVWSGIGESYRICCKQNLDMQLSLHIARVIVTVN